MADSLRSSCTVYIKSDLLIWIFQMITFTLWITELQNLQSTLLSSLFQFEINSGLSIYSNSKNWLFNWIFNGSCEAKRSSQYLRSKKFEIFQILLLLISYISTFRIMNIASYIIRYRNHLILNWKTDQSGIDTFTKLIVFHSRIEWLETIFTAHYLKKSRL